MAEYTPTTEQMLDMYAGYDCSDGVRRNVTSRRKEFYLWLERHAEQDERIQAWEAIAAHAAFADCYQEERPLLESVIDRIDALVSTEEAVVELAPSSLQAEIDRLNATIQRVRAFCTGQAREIRGQYGHTGPAGYLGFANACEDVIQIIDAARIALEGGD